MWSKRLYKQLVRPLFRGYNLHEYQSLYLLKSFGVPTPFNKVASSGSEAKDIAIEIGDENVVVKAQVLAGGRGKGKFIPNGFEGGVHIVSQNEVELTAESMIGKTLVTKQTGSIGKPCDKVLVMKKLILTKEFYLAFLLDRKFGGPVLVFSKHGGMDIEEVASRDPNEIFKIPISLKKGITADVSKEVTQKFGFSLDRADKIHELLVNLYRCFTEKDLLLLEINPLGITDNNQILVCDAKLNFDDNAIFRQGDTHSIRDLRQENSDELEAHNAGLSYISMDGTIGCLVNGAGLAMATMDLIKLMGGNAANFLDVGGGAQEDQIVSALTILQNNNKVDSVLINIFGGIMRCDIIANGLITAVRKINFKKPIVARLCGTNWAQAKEIITKSGVGVIYEQDEESAVHKIVSISKILRVANKAGLQLEFKYKIE
jgi:succinyl-CoA synthetase beta subunit